MPVAPPHPGMSSEHGLTLGALYREMRAGVGDAGRVRVTVEFQQRSLSADAPSDAGEPPHLVLETMAEYEDRVLDRAQVALYGSGPPKRFMVARHGDAHAYSLDQGERWGRLAANPRFFNLQEFEARLGQIPVEDATFDVLSLSEPGTDAQPVESPESGGPAAVEERFVDALDVSLDRSAFLRLLDVFSADVDEAVDAPLLDAFSVSVEAADDVALHYWWSLSDGPSAAALPLRVRCNVSIRVATLGAGASAAVRLDPSLPEVADLDSVWAILRHGAPGAAGGPPG